MADIAVVGCGPKAVALAAKAAVLSREGYSAPNIVIFERDRAASAWRGSGGYTDGIQPLCTLAERDLGFPYSRASFGSGAAQTMYADYSWQAYAVAQGVDRAQYDQWVLRGRNPPAHDEFARYLLYALNRAGVHPVTREVTSLDYDSASQRWLVESKDAVAATQIDPFDGVVITGSGPALPPLEVHLPNGIVTHGNPRVFDGITFWKNLAKVEQILAAEKPSDRSVVIVGAVGQRPLLHIGLFGGSWMLESRFLDGRQHSMHVIRVTSKIECLARRPIGQNFRPARATSLCHD